MTAFQASRAAGICFRPGVSGARNQASSGQFLWGNLRAVRPTKKNKRAWNMGRAPRVKPARPGLPGSGINRNKMGAVHVFFISLLCNENTHLNSFQIFLLFFDLLSNCPLECSCFTVLTGADAFPPCRLITVRSGFPSASMTLPDPIGNCAAPTEYRHLSAHDRLESFDVAGRVWIAAINISVTIFRMLPFCTPRMAEPHPPRLTTSVDTGVVLQSTLDIEYDGLIDDQRETTTMWSGSIRPNASVMVQAVHLRPD